jgi:hypothetical protein
MYNPPIWVWNRATKLDMATHRKFLRQFAVTVAFAAVAVLIGALLAALSSRHLVLHSEYAFGDLLRQVAVLAGFAAMSGAFVDLIRLSADSVWRPRPGAPLRAHDIGNRMFG